MAYAAVTSIATIGLYIAYGIPILLRLRAGDINYAIVAVAVVLLGTGAWWLASARRWFTGPRVQGTAQELAAIEAELEEEPGPAPAA